MSQADLAQFSALEVGKYRAQLLRFARARMRDPAQAEDAVQDALVAALESGGTFGGKSAIGTWLTGILRHKIVDRIRRAAREGHMTTDERELVSETGDPEAALARKVILQYLDRCLSELPPKTTQVLLLRDVIGLTTAEASKELGISTANCCVMLHRARQRLRERLSVGGIRPDL